METYAVIGSTKLCECGCGQPAPIAPHNDKRRGYVKGQPVRFIRGHSSRVPPRPGEETAQARGGRKRVTLVVHAGERFGRAVVVDPEVRASRKGATSSGTTILRSARLQCECGNVFVSALQALKSGSTQSCGCLRLERQTGQQGVATQMGEHGRPIKNFPRGPQPDCRCGCEAKTSWNSAKDRWNTYADHWQRDRARLAQMIHEEYVICGRDVAEIGAAYRVDTRTVNRCLARAGITKRPPDHSKQGSPGPRNAAWKGGVSKWPYSPDWKALARSIRNRDKWTCQDCGERRKRWGAALHVHHIDGNKLNNDPANLISLCAQCHQNRHKAMLGLVA